MDINTARTAFPTKHIATITGVNLIAGCESMVSDEEGGDRTFSSFLNEVLSVGGAAVFCLSLDTTSKEER